MNHTGYECPEEGDRCCLVERSGRGATDFVLAKLRMLYMSWTSRCTTDSEFEIGRSY